MFCRVCGYEFDNTKNRKCPRCGKEFVTGKENLTGKLSADKPAVRMRVAERTDWDRKTSGRKRTDRATEGRKNRKLVLFAVPVLVVVVLLIILGTSGATSSAKKVALAANKYLMEGKMDKYYKLLTPQYKEYMVGSKGWYRDEDEFKEDMLDMAKERKQEIVSRCGDDAKIEYKVLLVDQFDGDDYDNAVRELSRDYNYDAKEIQGAAEVTVALDASGKKGTSSWSVNMACIKTHGKWYVHRPGFN